MIKLYKIVKGTLNYHEAWENDGIIYEHWGVVGKRGNTREHKLDKNKDQEESIRGVLHKALTAGFQPIGLEHHAVLLIEYPIDDMGCKEDVDKRHALQDRMNELLGWTGLGMCDGGSIGSGTMEVCCFVVDFDIAARVIKNDLQGTIFSDFSRIYNERS